MRNCKRSLSCPTASGRARLTNLRVYTGAKARPPGLRRQLTLRCENAASIAGDTAKATSAGRLALAMRDTPLCAPQDCFADDWIKTEKTHGDSPSIMGL